MKPLFTNSKNIIKGQLYMIYYKLIIFLVRMYTSAVPCKYDLTNKILLNYTGDHVMVFTFYPIKRATCK